VAGKVGTCSPVSGAPKNGRPACVSDGSVCGGTCNGTLTTACAFPGASTSCRAAACSNAQATLEAACDGKGSCPPIAFKSCAPYGCEGPICGGGCTVEADCQLGFFCEGGACSPKKAQGQACTGNAQCSTDYCVDGVCCDKPCKGQCEACNAQGNPGVCLPVVGAPQNGRPACAGEGPCVGFCDGASGVACTFPGAGVLCREPSCSENVATLPAFCNSQGGCPGKQTQLCSPFSCAETQCAGDCQIDSDCLNGTFCSAGICTAKKVLGDTCADGSQCASGFCADGVCCSSACDGQCEACNLPVTKGTCSVILNGQPSPGKPACPGSGDCQGYCDGSSKTQCYLPTTKKLCSPVSCDNNLYSAAAYCDGVGNCDAPKVSNCGAYSCGPGGCKIQCLTSADCAEGYACNSDNTCKPIPGAGGNGGSGGAGGSAGEAGQAGGGEAGDGGSAGDGGTGGSGEAGKPAAGGAGQGGNPGGSGGKAGGGGAEPPASDFDPGSDGACGCRAAGASPAPTSLALAALGLAAALVRRRRR
jgi:MYXO-CTERM domain-containing protein